MQPKKVWICACIFLSATGLCVVFMWPVMRHCTLSLNCNFVLYYLWKNVPFTLEAKFYFFNWTNPEDIYNASVKPRFEEVGPYVFLQNEEKSNVVWNDNGTITFELRRFWTFDEKLSNLTLQDRITNIDISLLVISISFLTRSWNYYLRKGAFVPLAAYFSTIHDSHTVSELLFEGYPEPLVRMARALPIFDSLKLPPWNKFGWMYNRNGTTDFDGIFNMGTGSNSDLGKIYNWNYEAVTGYYESTCNKVSGFSGQLFANITHEPLEIFSSDLRRTISLQFEKEENVKGILGYKYVSGNYMLDNGTMDHKHKCYCTGECILSGLVNISNTRHNSPIFVSMPNFYGADPYYLNMVEGLKPEKEKHEVSFTIEPNSGFVLEANAKLQLNLFMQPVTGTYFFDGVPKVFFPVMWAQQDFVVGEREVFLLNIFLNLPAICISLGILMILSGAILFLYQIFKHERKDASPPHDQLDKNVFLFKAI